MQFKLGCCEQIIKKIILQDIKLLDHVSHHDFMQILGNWLDLNPFHATGHTDM